MTTLSSAKTIVTSAPGRICLFGEHQDYLGLPVIAAAINLRVQVAAKPINSPLFEINLPDIESTRTIDPSIETEYLHDRDYLPAAVNVLRRQGLSWSQGYKINVTSDIPINSGASSSSALQIAWCAFLLAAAGDDRYKDPKQVARIAHQSEVLEFNSPGGMMDHFACAMGNTIWLDCQPPYAAEELPSLTNDILLVDSGIPKDTNGVLGGRRKTLENLKIDFTNLELIPDEKSLSENFTKLQQAALHATLNNRRLTVEARSLLKEPSLDIEKLGLLLSGHHRNLSEFLNVSLSEIDDLIEQGIQQGALGGKINGSGCGGSFFFLCHNNSEQLCTYFTTRGYDSYIVKVGKGLSVSIKDQKAEVAVS